MAERLYTLSEVATLLDVKLWRLRNALRDDIGVPAPFYRMGARPGQENPLYRQSDVDAWDATLHPPAVAPPPPPKPRSSYSDHDAVNTIGTYTVTWRLWWIDVDPAATGPVWWFSTPLGWYCSRDGGRSWAATGQMTRPAGHYRPLNTPERKGMPPRAVAAHNGAQRLQERIEQQIVLDNGQAT